jgi:hypothetical protein
MYICTECRSVYGDEEEVYQGAHLNEYGSAVLCFPSVREATEGEREFYRPWAVEGTKPPSQA